MSHSQEAPVYFISQTVTLTKEDVVEALRRAAIVKAEDMSRFGPIEPRSVEIDARLEPDGSVAMCGASVTIVARLRPELRSRLEAVATGRSSAAPLPAQSIQSSPPSDDY